MTTTSITASLTISTEPNRQHQPQLPVDAAELSAIIAMAWADEVPFAAITKQYGLSEAQIIALMRRELKRSSFRLWRARVTGRQAKHAARAAHRQQCSLQEFDSPNADAQKTARSARWHQSR